MLSLFTTTVLIGLFTAGSFLVKVNVSSTDETVQYISGRTEKVSVRNGNSYYCPYTCQINHRHDAHDQDWKCDLDHNCSHFIVRYGPTEDSQHDTLDEYAAANETHAPGQLAEQPAPNQ